MKRLQKGFTLIELLVVIAIIGILAGVVLINVNNARQRARSAAIVTAVSQVRSQQELLSEYVDVDTTTNPDIVSLRNNVQRNGGALTGSATTGLNQSWVAWSNLPATNGGDKGVCADSSGISKVYKATDTWAPTAGMTECP